MQRNSKAPLESTWKMKPLLLFFKDRTNQRRDQLSSTQGYSSFGAHSERGKVNQ